MNRFPVLIVPFLVLPAFGQDASKPRDWQTWLRQIVDDIETSSRRADDDLLTRRIRRPNEFLASASALPEQFNVRVHCTLTAQAAANYAFSLRQGKAATARADLKEYRRYDRDCGAAITKYEKAVASPASPPAPPELPTQPATDGDLSPASWLATVKYDAKSALEAAKIGRVNLDVLRAVSRSALVYRQQIAGWSPSPKSSEAYGICGDAVIALANVADAPRSALEDYLRLEPRCEAAIGRR